MQKLNQKTALIIMDGWGIETDKTRSAIAQAHTPFVDSLYKKYPNSTLITYGTDVGLPKGQMGNSEVGHMNLGAGRVVFQELQRINNAIDDGALENNTVFNKLLNYAISNSKPLHLMGLVSDGGVHSHINHLIGLCQLAHKKGVKEIYIHCFTDGRDCDPKTGKGFIEQLENEIKNTNAKIASVVGRYYAMDRDKRWERIAEAYHLLVNGKGNAFENATEGIEASYQNDVTDEFIKPIVIVDKNKKPIATIKNNDAVLCFNFRTDRCREITQVLTIKDFPEYDMHKLQLAYYTMTRYDETFTNIPVLFSKENINNTIGEILAKNGKTQLRIAETEKYPHVSFFFSGGREKPFEGESRIMVNSPKVATYDLQPEMSAFEVKDKAVAFIKDKQPDFICLNFANTDMVGHTGVFKAAMKAAETVDQCVKEVIETALNYDYDILLTADHGNADIMINEDGTPHTAHTKNLVPLFYISNNKKYTELKNGKLGDLAPTLLKLMGINKPKEMTGNELL
ncbi:MAG: 2,3-bisphosphoglycerate-independent phosphoglycerate mutase [Bacteroidetes bacterium]|nr:2,3-bisphosphoglycerate-independent phosphoglycerate mutase [Bacteroidota bacterium]MCB9226847.1 2,3-bisphosphoglycerate-independent phosphoglycerate mutase [Chitinophagales bacterium]